MFHVLDFPNCLLSVVDLSDFLSCNIFVVKCTGKIFLQDTFLLCNFSTCLLVSTLNEFGWVDPPLGDNETLQWGRETITLYCLSFLCPFLGSCVVDHNTNSSKNAQRILLGDYAVASLWSLFSICAIEISFLMAVVLGFEWENLSCTVLSLCFS